MAVNRPGSLYFSAMAVVRSQALLANFGSMMSGGSFLFDCAAMSSITAAEALSPPSFIIWLQRLSVGSAIISGSPSRIRLITPMPSEWSVMTIQSSGRESCAGCPLVAITSSPRANRNASSGPSVVPLMPASPDQPVCTCSSPNSGRVG